MKIEFIEARYTGKYFDMDNLREKLKDLPENIFLGSSVQFLDYLEKLKITLESMGKTVFLITGAHSSVRGQILGCDIYGSEKIFRDFKKVGADENNQMVLENSCFLIVSTGEFHALSGVLAELDKTDKAKTFALNPINGNITKLDNKFSVKGQYLKFLEAENIGILITTKPGQHDVLDVDKIIGRYPEKNFYKIISDNISPASLADYNYLDYFINTACPRMIDEKENFPRSVINMKNLLYAIRQFQ